MGPGSKREITTSVNRFVPQAMLSERYRIIEQIGAGGMGIVFRAQDQHLGRPVAIKILPASLSGEANALARFRNEARVLSQLNHPGICTIHDLGDHEGRPFIVMELLLGRTLEEAIGGSPMAADAVAEIACHVAAGLEAAHAAQIIHRDLKPGNILLTDDNAAKILDFGVAKFVGEVTIGPDEATQMQPASEFTRVGSLIGTPRYMSPEQVRGDDLDPRTDLFSFGAVLYEMTTGRPPFSGATVAEVREAVLHHRPVPPSQVNPSVPPGMDKIIGKLLENDRGRRYQSIGELHADLREARTATTGASDDLEPARQAYRCGDWRRAFSVFGEADGNDALPTPDLERFADAAFWLSEYPVFLDALERAHTRYVQAGESADAARVAVRLADEHNVANRRTVGSGWLRRAERLLAGVPECAAHGYVSRCKCKTAIEVEQDFERGLRLAEETLAIAKRCNDPDLHAYAVQDRGRCLVMLGQVEQGMELLDEAMVDAMAGELSPLTVGVTYCNMIDTCERLGDYRRASEWCDHASGWCASHPQSVFPGVCTVHRAEVMRMRGDWETAEAEAKRLIEEHRSRIVFIAALASSVVGNIELRRGRLDEAEAAFRQTLALGGDPMPGLALLRIEQGRFDDAESMITRALEERPSVLDHARLLVASVEAALAAGNVPAASQRVEELEAVAARCQSPTFKGSTTMLRGAIALANGNSEEAIGTLRRAAEKWRDLGMPWETARSRHLLSKAYRAAGDTDLADLESGAARAIFDRLGAAH